MPVVKIIKNNAENERLEFVKNKKENLFELDFQ